MFHSLKILFIKFFYLRARYIFTRSGRLRLRYVMPFAFCLLALPFLFSNIVASFISYGAVTSSVANIIGIQTDYAALSSPENHENPSAGHSPVSSGIRKAAVAIQKPTLPLYKEIKINAGETLAGALQGQGVGGKDTYFALEAMSKYYDVRKIRPGQVVDVYFKRAPDGEARVFEHLEMKLDPVRNVKVSRTGEYKFAANLEEKELVTRTYARSATIDSSLYASAAKNDIPDKVVANLIKLYSWSLNMKKDIRRGDEIEVLYETTESEDGTYSRTGKILHANLKLGNREYPIYRFEMADGRIDYFEPSGMTVKKALMKNPVSNTRISSGYGMRRHPILGYKKMHTGIDFAAPKGTPIYATGSGIIDFIGRKGGYGNYIAIRHNATLKTAYAHLNGFKSGLKKGQRVKQGDLIGYVGTTGRSTGPHLHYEVLVNNQHVNPRSKQLPTGEQLQGKEMQQFKTVMASMNRQYAELKSSVKLASFFPHKSEDPDHKIHIR